MSERRDLEASLAEMDRKVRELQRELAQLSPHSKPGGVASGSAAPEPAAERIAELGRRVDGLAALCADVQHATRSLREELDGGADTPAPQ